ncbi:DUF4276 family protein [Fibrella rubiginis]|uniref:DUF4276 family protein n=1 Tax=Fibrella rubiginis TaxID=2817060 RepID=UPI00286E5DD9|nr:DUF4276 family protein [Fibrella rubiginis]
MKIGIIVEGDCERIVLKSIAFYRYLEMHQIQLVDDVINIGGKGNLKQSSKRMPSQVQALRDLGAEHVVVLRDLDEAESLESVDRIKAEVYQAGDVSTCLAIQELEAWFLADSVTLSLLFNASFYCEQPQVINKPANYLSALRTNYTGRGISDKKGFASAMINNGFTIERAAEHPNCPSARYFLTKLQTIASATFL